jgi:hypothetical protein
MKTKSNEISIIDTLMNSDLTSVSKDIAEIAIDGILKEGFLKDLPIINSLFATFKTGISIRDNLFTRKLLRFLYGVNEISPEDRKIVIEKLDSNPKYVGEMLMISLERMDDMKKPYLLAKAFFLLSKDKISSNDFYGLKAIIDRIDLSDIPEIIKFYEDYLYCPHELASYLLQSKMATISISGIQDPAHPLFKSTKIGKLFITEVLEIELNEKTYI